MRCEDVVERIPALLDAGGRPSLDVQRHITSCTRCQAEMIRYRRILRGLQDMRTATLQPAPDAISKTLASLWEAGERRAVLSMIQGRRARYLVAVGGIVAVAALAGLLVGGRRGRQHRSSGAPAVDGGQAGRTSTTLGSSSAASRANVG